MTATKKKTEEVIQGHECEACAPLYEHIAELQAKLNLAEQKIVELERRAVEGRAGYIVTTPSKAYSGMTAGVQFRNGRAFIPAGENGQRIANMLAAEFDYQVTYVTDWQSMPEGPAISKTLIDSLVLPERR